MAAQVVPVPVVGSTKMLADVAKKHSLSIDKVFAIWCDCVREFHPEVVATAEAEMRAHEARHYPA